MSRSASAAVGGDGACCFRFTCSCRSCWICAMLFLGLRYIAIACRVVVTVYMVTVPLGCAFSVGAGPL